MWKVTLHNAPNTLDVEDGDGLGCCICFKVIEQGQPYAVQADWKGGAWHVECVDNARRAYARELRAAKTGHEQ